MGYTGVVSVGGRADVRELPAMTISKLAVGGMNNNAYLLRCTATDTQVLIDAAAEGNRLLTLVGSDPLYAVITTHAHHDHWTALAEVITATGAQTMAHHDDAPNIEMPTTRTLTDGEHITIGRFTLTAIHLVGHTPGSVALLYDDPDGPPHLWTGDCLFPGGAGNTQGDPSRFTALMDGLEAKIFATLPDETWVYPGHGSDTTLGAQRPHLAEWRARGW